ncbi:MAG: bifunctional folylpolyglutamate synthase/dihydrofolate synthase, partial [Acidimicrobiia bacterium]
MAGVLELMGNPHQGYPSIHIAGTNGKTSTTRMAAALLASHGLSVGAYTSPHLERVEERAALNGDPMSPEEFAVAVADVRPFVDLFEERTGDGITYFELTTVIALSWFAVRPVDVAIVEVGLGGRLDGTNVVDGQVAVLTGVALEHTKHLGDTLDEIA